MSERYDAVLLDMDGVLVERSPGWVFAEAAADAFDAFDVDPDEDDLTALRAAVDSGDGDDHPIAERYGVSVGSLWATREGLAAVNQVRAMEAGEKRPYDGAADALASLSPPTAVVSNNSQQAVELVVRRFGFDEHLREWHGIQPTVADAQRRKPDPVTLEDALRALDAETAVYVGDRGSDVAAAHAAGIDSAFVHRPFNEADDLEPTPTHELDSLADLPAVVRNGR